VIFHNDQETPLQFLVELLNCLKLHDNASVSRNEMTNICGSISTQSSRTLNGQRSFRGNGPLMQLQREVAETFGPRQFLRPRQGLLVRCRETVADEGNARPELEPSFVIRFT